MEVRDTLVNGRMEPQKDPVAEQVKLMIGDLFLQLATVLAQVRELSAEMNTLKATKAKK